MEREPIDWHSREARRKASLTGTACRDDGTSQRIVVTNISYHGCDVFPEDFMSQGETSEMTVPTICKLKVQVRWADGARAGVRFLVEGSVAEQRRARLGF